MWIAGSIAAVVGLLAVVAALLLDRPADADPPADTRRRGLPRPSEVRAMRFPTTWWGGYDQRAVDAELHDLAERYEALYLAAGPSAIAEAERRLTGGPPATAEPATAEQTAADGTAEAPEEPWGTPGVSAEELEDGGRDGAGVLDR